MKVIKRCLGNSIIYVKPQYYYYRRISTNNNDPLTESSASSIFSQLEMTNINLNDSSNNNNSNNNFLKETTRSSALSLDDNEDESLTSPQDHPFQVIVTRIMRGKTIYRELARYSQSNKEFKNNRAETYQVLLETVYKYGKKNIAVGEINLNALTEEIFTRHRDEVGGLLFAYNRIYNYPIFMFLMKRLAKSKQYAKRMIADGMVLHLLKSNHYEMALKSMVERVTKLKLSGSFRMTSYFAAYHSEKKKHLTDALKEEEEELFNFWIPENTDNQWLSFRDQYKSVNTKKMMSSIQSFVQRKLPDQQISSYLEKRDERTEKLNDNLLELLKDSNNLPLIVSILKEQVFPNKIYLFDDTLIRIMVKVIRDGEIKVPEYIRIILHQHDIGDLLYRDVNKGIKKLGEELNLDFRTLNCMVMGLLETTDYIYSIHLIRKMAKAKQPIYCLDDYCRIIIENHKQISKEYPSELSALIKSLQVNVKHFKYSHSQGFQNLKLKNSFEKQKFKLRLERYMDDYLAMQEKDHTSIEIGLDIINYLNPLKNDDSQGHQENLEILKKYDVIFYDMVAKGIEPRVYYSALIRLLIKQSRVYLIREFLKSNINLLANNVITWSTLKEYFDSIPETNGRDEMIVEIAELMIDFKEKDYNLVFLDSVRKANHSVQSQKITNFLLNYNFNYSQTLVNEHSEIGKGKSNTIKYALTKDSIDWLNKYINLTSI